MFYTMKGYVPNKKTCVKQSIKIKIQYVEFGRNIKVKIQDLKKKGFLEFSIKFYCIYLIEFVLFGALSSII